MSNAIKNIFMQMKAADSEHGEVRPYEDGHDHLRDELRWLNTLLSAYLLRMRNVNFYGKLKDLREFFISDEEIDVLLDSVIAEPSAAKEARQFNDKVEKIFSQAQEMRQQISRRINLSLNRNIYLPLVQLERLFHLDPFELQVLLVCIAPQLDARYEKLYAYLQNDITQKSPGVDFILNLLWPNAEERWQNLKYFHPAATLHQFGLIETIQQDYSASHISHFLRADSRIANFVVGNNIIDKRLVEDLRFYPPMNWNQLIVKPEFKDFLEEFFKKILQGELPQPAIVYFQGRSGGGKKSIARALCHEAGVALAETDMRTLLDAPENFLDKLRLILREGVLQPCALCFTHIEKLINNEQEYSLHLDILVREIQKLGWIIFLCSESPLPVELLELPGICPVEIPKAEEDEQKLIWEKQLHDIKCDSPGFDLDQLTSRFDLTAGQIVGAVRLAKQSLLSKNHVNPELSITDLFRSSRILSQPKLSSLARKIDPQFRWENLVLPQDQLRQLQEMAAQVKYRKVVMKDWGFEKKLSLGKGLNALFSGPSGTGKTMAAEVISNELGLDLYKIDLSAVVSKYIGETEKNLNRIFNEAEHSNAILFFDEADALLGKRSEVKDAHDRYANIEIAYLLQKMEEYEGITILASNLRKNIDEAFTRRIRFIIEFPFPEEEYRRRIWEGIWPREIRLEPGVDLNFMARQFELAGGNIRNIALTAAFFAADNGQAVGMKHLVLAAKREFQKMGKLCEKADFGEYYALL